MIWFKPAELSTPHASHTNGIGWFAASGGTSISYFAPQLHWILRVMSGPWVEKDDALGQEQRDGRADALHLHVAIAEEKVAAILVVIVAGFGAVRREDWLALKF